MKTKICWVVTNGAAGTVSQALGLAQAVGFKKIEQKIFKTNFIASLFPRFTYRFVDKFLCDDSDKLEEPWPDIVIGCGRRVIPFLLYIKEITNGKTYSIYIQDPKISSKYFDLVIKMSHDLIKGDNVITTDFSLNLISKNRLSEELKKHEQKFIEFASPYFAVLIGGNTKRYKMDNNAVQDILDKISAIIKLCPGSVLITTSRRTPDLLKDALNSNFGHNKKLYIINPDSKDGNLYFAMLAIAEKIFVTNDSVNMISEACACEKPVYIMELSNISLGKTTKFLQTLRNKNMVEIFDGKLKKMATKIEFNNNELIASKLQKRLLKNKICDVKDFKYHYKSR